MTAVPDSFRKWRQCRTAVVADDNV